MTTSITFDQLLRMRIWNQRLHADTAGPPSDVAELVHLLCGIQAQEMPAAALAVRPRTKGVMAADVHQARVVQRGVVRTWAQRGTLHLLAAEDLPWLLALLGPSMVAASRRRRLELGLDDATYEDALRVVKQVLAAEGPLTRVALFQKLAAHGVRIEGQARPHLLSRAALERMLCLGPDHGTEPTYVLLADWLGRPVQDTPMDADVAHAELTRRYLAAYGPATPQDQAAWSGLPLSRTRMAWQQVAGELTEIEVDGQPAWVWRTGAAAREGTAPVGPVVRLLPRYDTYLLGYQERSGIVPEEHRARVNAGGGIVHPTVLVEGRVVGTWSGTSSKRQLTVNVAPFGQLEAAVIAGLEKEVADLGRFLAVTAICNFELPG